MNTAVLLLLPCLLAATEPLAELTAWPAVVTADERQQVAFRLHAPDAGAAVIAWDGAPAGEFAVPVGVSDGLLVLPTGLGLHQGEARLGGGSVPLAIRLAAVEEPWPIAGLRDGLPVDATGAPVVLVERRRTVNDLRRERLVERSAPRRPVGRPLLVGDPLGDAWRGLNAELRAIGDVRYPQHAALVTLASVAQSRSIVWSPGNGALFARTWSGEGRLCSALSARLTAMGIRPRLVLALPPAPVAAAWAADDARRRQELSAAARAAGWELCDLAAAAGDPLIANRLAAGLYDEHPVGAALERVRTTLRDELAR
jgi:hypothetical protein